MIIIDRIYKESELPVWAKAYARDTVTLGWEQRLHVHGRRATDGGVEFGTSLPRGTQLRGGDCLLLDEAHVVASIVERPEAVFVVAPGTPYEWALFAYHIGNRHQPIMFAADAIVCPDAPGVEALLQQYAMPYTRATRPFTPVTTAVGHEH